VQAWIEEMASYVKSLDSKHLLTVGLEGFYKHGSRGSFEANPTHTPRSGTDFIQNHQVAGIDFATVHAYPDLWYASSSPLGWIPIFVEFAPMHWL